MKLPPIIIGAALAALFLTQMPPAWSAPPSPETARLAGLCRIWGVVKDFHPSLAYQPIDWDQALVRAIPKVRAAKTSADYADAVDSMLATLRDPNTHVVRQPAVTLAATPASQSNKNALKQPSVSVEPDGTAVITATDYSQFTDMGMAGAMAKALQGTKSARAPTRTP